MTPEATRRRVRGAVRDGLLAHKVTLAVAAVILIGIAAVAFTPAREFASKIADVQASAGRLSSPVFPGEALGIWPAANYRLDAAGGAQLAGLAGAIATLAVALGAIWWVRRRKERAVPIALAACAALYLVSLPFSGDYSQAKALMIGAPLAMLVAIRPLLAELTSATPRRFAWAALAVVFVGGALYSSFLALRDAPVGPPGHGAARHPPGQDLPERGEVGRHPRHGLHAPG